MNKIKLLFHCRPITTDAAPLVCGFSRKAKGWMKKRFKNLWCRRGGCPTGLAKARQIGLLRRAQKASATSGCPIDFEQTAQFPVLPEGRADQGKEPGEAVRPLAQPSAERAGVKMQRKWVKVSTIVLCGSLLPLSLVLDWGPGNDKCHQARELMAKAGAATLPATLYADAGYDAEWIHGIEKPAVFALLGTCRVPQSVPLEGAALWGVN
jgi:hypothetical protein